MAHPVVHCTFELGDERIHIGDRGDEAIWGYMDDENDYIISTFWQLDSDERMAIMDGARIVLRMMFGTSEQIPPTQIHVEGVGVTMSHTKRAPRG